MPHSEPLRTRTSGVPLFRSWGKTIPIAIGICIEDLSGNEYGEEILVAAPPATKKQAPPHSEAGRAGKRTRPAKTPPRSTSPDDNGPFVKAMVTSGIPCHRPMADTTQDVGVKGIMGAHWLL